MPRLSTPSAAARPGPAPIRATARGGATPQKRSRKPATMQDRLKARTLYFRRVKRSLKPGLWVLAAMAALFIAAQAWRAVPRAAPAQAIATGHRHAGLASLAAAAGFQVHAIDIIGADTIPHAAILAALGIQPGDPSLSISLTAAVTRLEALGPVATATVQRALPGTLIVTITERAPYAIWQTATADGTPAFVLIDKSGNIIANQDAAAAKRRDPSLLLLVGADAPANAAALQTALAADDAVLARVAAAERIGGLRWNLILKNRTLVKLPTDNPQSALDQLASLQTSMSLLDRPVESIDMRLPGRMIIHPYPSAYPSANPTTPAAGHT